MAFNRSRTSRLRVEQLEDRQLLATACLLPSACELPIISGTRLESSSQGYAKSGHGFNTLVDGGGNGVVVQQGGKPHASFKRQQLIPHSHVGRSRGKPARQHSQRVSPSSLQAQL